MVSVQHTEPSFTSLAESLLAAAKKYEASGKAKDDPLQKANIIKTAGQISKQVKDRRDLIFDRYAPVRGEKPSNATRKPFQQNLLADISLDRWQKLIIHGRF